MINCTDKFGEAELQSYSENGLNYFGLLLTVGSIIVTIMYELYYSFKKH